MSEGPRIPRAIALKLAQRLTEALRPHCARIEIAGSLRRGKPDVGDIELVCIPQASEMRDLFGDVTLVRDPAPIYATMHELGYPCHKGGDKYAQFGIGQINLDLFMTTPECWGVIFTIRTGPADWAKLLVTQRSKGGLCPSHLQFEGGRIVHRQSKIALETPEEADVFAAINHKWVAPEDRK